MKPNLTLFAAIVLAPLLTPLAALRAAGPTANLSISDWAKPDAPGASIGQELILNFVELQPVLE
jgi:hypothetical protein